MKRVVILCSLLMIVSVGCTNVQRTSISTSQPVQQDQSPVVGSEKTLMVNDTTMTEDTIKLQYERATFKTSMGDIVVEFYGNESPKTVKNFHDLAEKGFYDEVRFHRVIEDFMIQAGDPLSKDVAKKAMWGTGGPGYTFDDEFNDKPLVKGSLAMANAGPDTNGSQFFIVTATATPWLDGNHTNFGYVTEGMDVVEAISRVERNAKDQPLGDIVIESIVLE